jgi:hypothetical protein
VPGRASQSELPPLSRDDYVNWTVTGLGCTISALWLLAPQQKMGVRTRGPNETSRSGRQ